MKKLSHAHNTKIKPVSFNLLLIAILFLSCSGSTGTSANPNDDATANGSEPTKISQFDRAGFSDFLIDKNGVYHAVFQESPAIGKPTFIYYSASVNKGASWSKPVVLSNDFTGNGSGAPRLLQDAGGKIYAIWKRWGSSSGYPVADDIMDGPGGYRVGTLFYKVLDGGAWSNQVKINEKDVQQGSWFATVAPSGGVYVFWTQLYPQSRIADWLHCDWLRMAALNGTNATFRDITPPPAMPSGPYANANKTDGGINLEGYIDRVGKVHMVYEDNINDTQEIKYFDGQTQKIVYTYPKWKQGNTFNNPGRLLFDEKGHDHLIFLPCPATLDSEQLWDMDLTANKTNVLTSVEKPDVRFKSFQVTQGLGGT
ncbi:MAG: hypothetical protein JST32_20910, partial [Bacteroidetes bacterium]|nr:hypothetical protein [Bacteroidota bacterium]